MAPFCLFLGRGGVVLDSPMVGVRLQYRVCGGIISWASAPALKWQHQEWSIGGEQPGSAATGLISACNLITGSELFQPAVSCSAFTILSRTRGPDCSSPVL